LSTTLQVYTHASGTAQRQAVNQLEDMRLFVPCYYFFDDYYN
jgi:hypothetical protein